MKPPHYAFSAATFLLIACVSAGAQQTTGTPDAPDATTTIDGNYFLPPPPRFGGTINMGGQGQQETDLTEVSQRVCRLLCNRLSGCNAHPRSHSGQNAKYSSGADVFRSTPESGLKSDIAPCPKSARIGLTQKGAELVHA
jgi:hypothetical protein